ncbi:MAG: cardiolipin synthase [Planctomycetota bacterium]|nr:cardiolipin synthase [Planctomycetota bacterium]
MTQSLLTALVFIVEFMVRLGLVGYLLIRQHKTPSSRAAWVVVILAVPFGGSLLYLLVGEVKLGSRRLLKYGKVNELIDADLSKRKPPPFQSELTIPKEFMQMAHLAELTGENPPWCGNSLKLLSDTDIFIQSLVEDIDASTRHCHLLSYIYLTDHSSTRLAEAMIRAVKRGVKCRVLVDSVGSSMFLKSSLRKRMSESGVQVVEALPANALRMLLARIDLRNHRKIVIIDDHIGYMGSHNIADAEFAVKPRFAPWVDIMVRVRGPVVFDLQTLFVQDWFIDTQEYLEEAMRAERIRHPDNVMAQIIGTGPTNYAEAMRQFMIASFNLGREELIMTTPYFVPDDATATALRTSARRGVETTLSRPARNESPLVAAASRSQYESLLEAGVQICEYEKGLLHAKTLTIDRRLALISSANLDRRSFELNFEVSMVVYDSDFASQVRFLQKSYLNDSRKIRVDHWQNQGWSSRLWQNAIGIFSPLL